MELDVSIIIPTFNRYQALKNALKSLTECRPLSSEVIVVDQSVDSKKKSFYFCKLYPFLKYFYLSQPNLPKARNTGILKSCGKIIYFMDDDAIIDPCCLKEHLIMHRINKIHAVAGRIRQMNGNTWSNLNVVTEIDNETGDVKGNFDLDVESNVLYASGGNMSIKREVFEKCGLFNTKFIGNALFEDVEFFMRIRKHGYFVKYNPNAIVYHNSEKSGGCHDSEGINYYLERLHNHTLFYTLHLRWIPSRAFLLYLKNLVEYISRKKNRHHSIIQIVRCLNTIIKAYINAIISNFYNLKLNK